jgi:protein-L-isoaspartate O-methyltransferase
VSSPQHLWRTDWQPRVQAIATAEARALGAGDCVAPGLFVSEVPYPRGRIAFGIGGGRVLASGAPETLETPAGEPVHVVKAPCKQSGSPLEFLARLPAKPAFANRGARLELYCPEGDWYLVEHVPEAAYVPPELPRRTSTSLPSRLARAVVNLVAQPGERVLDPLCGTGVLLAEAAQIGCEVEGSDLTWKAVRWGRENFAALGLDGTFRRADALELEPADPPYDVLVGDLPYGRRLEPSDPTPLVDRLPRLGRRWALVAHVDLSAELAAAGHEVELHVEVPKATFVRHVFVGGEAR